MLFNIVTTSVVATLTVYWPVGGTCQISSGGTTLNAVGTSGMYMFMIPFPGTWNISVLNNGNSSVRQILIETGGVYTFVMPSIPDYTYTGTAQLVIEGNGDWKIRFLTSGTFEITNYLMIDTDLFLVGGGGGGSQSNGEGGGGGGGYTQTFKSIAIDTTESYQIVIGDGGDVQADGSASSAFGKSAAGGKSGNGVNGGNGGSGGSSGSHLNNGYNLIGSAGGSDGSNGGQGYYQDPLPDGGYTPAGPNGTPGTGQNSTTREFEDANGTLYAGGGGGLQSPGGAGGGGRGYTASNGATAGQANTGGGGGGGGNLPDGHSGSARAGGSGIVILRNHR